jgi:hypothetical protein
MVKAKMKVQFNFNVEDLKVEIKGFTKGVGQYPTTTN